MKPLTLSFGSPRRSIRCEGCQRCSRMVGERHDRAATVIGVAIMIAVAELCPDLSQIARTDWLPAKRAERLPAGRLVIHQYEFHVEPPRAKQNTVSDEWEIFGGGAQR